MKETTDDTKHCLCAHKLQYGKDTCLSYSCRSSVKLTCWQQLWASARVKRDASLPGAIHAVLFARG